MFSLFMVMASAAHLITDTAVYTGVFVDFNFPETSLVLSGSSLDTVMASLGQAVSHALQ